MDTQLSKFSILRMTSPKNGDLCHSAFVSCDTISSERIAPPLAPDLLSQDGKRREIAGRNHGLQLSGRHTRRLVKQPFCDTKSHK